jgi:ribosomal protein S27AE
VFGDYTGDCCPNCGRDRLMSCTDDSGVNRVICEKCNFEPAKGIYLSEALD